MPSPWALIPELGLFEMAMALTAYVLCTCWLSAIKKRNNKDPTGLPTRWPLLGMTPALWRNRHRLYEWSTHVLISTGGTFAFHGPNFTCLNSLITADPANVAHVLKVRFESYPKGPHFQGIARDFLGHGIFNSDGPQWALQRSSAALHMTTPSFRTFAANTVGFLIHRRLIPLLDSFENASFDLQRVLLDFTFDNVCILALGADPCTLNNGCALSALSAAFDRATEATMLRFLLPKTVWRVLRFLNVGMERHLRNALYLIDDFTAKAIAEAKCRAAAGNDLLSAFLRNNNCHNNSALRDMCVNFVLAGRDTSSVALSWFFYLLSQHPTEKSRILQELSDIVNSKSNPDNVKNSAETFSNEDLIKMKYLQAALYESMRLYPSVPIDHKEAVCDDHLPDGRFVKKGMKILYCIYSMGRMPSIWGEDCMEFRPSRWLSRKGCESAYRYPVFNGGPRLCLGKSLALLQMKWIAASLLWRYEIAVCQKNLVRPRVALTLYIDGGLFVNIRQRHFPAPT